jgi:hypothetical protein
MSEENANPDKLGYLLRILIIGGGIDHPFLSTIVVMLIAGVVWVSCISYYKKTVPQASAASPPAVTTPQSPPPVAIDSPCANSNIAANGDVLVNCDSSTEVHDAHKHSNR